jgi:hypothetical protein
MKTVEYADRQLYVFPPPPQPLPAGATNTVQLRLMVPHTSFFDCMKLEKILNLHWSLVQADPDLRRIFPRKPMIVRKKTDNVKAMIEKAYAKPRG